MAITDRKRRHGKKLLSRHVQDGIREIIASLKPGQAIPSQPELSTRFGVSAGTVAEAVKTLEKEGLVVRFKGSGVYVADPAAPAVAIAPSGTPGPIHAADFELLLARASIETGLCFTDCGERPAAAELLRRKVRGIIFLRGVSVRDYLAGLVKNGIHIVITDWAADLPGVDSINIDAFRAAELATETLIAAGHTRIAYIGTQPYDEERKVYTVEPDSEKHRAGCTTALMTAGLPVDPALLVRLRYPSPYAKREGAFSSEDIFQTLFKQDPPPTALIFFNMISVGLSMRSTLANHGLTIPQDVSVITLGALEESKGLTAVGCRHAELAEQACRRMAERLKADMPDKHNRILVGVKLINPQNTVTPPQAK